MDDSAKNEMYENYQPWVIKTYGDLSRTKTITLKKRARILKILRGEEQLSAENSKFRFWVRNKGFRINPPEGYVTKPADGIVGRNGLGGEKVDLYVPSGNKDIGSEYKKVAIVENFFDIIYGVHVEIDGRNGKHAGQKRTYRTITETYSFLPREAVTKFLLNCYECQKRPNSPAIKKILSLKPKTFKILPQLLENSFRVFPDVKMKNETDISETTESSNCEVSVNSEQNSPENLCKRDNRAAGERTNHLHTSTPLRGEKIKHNILDLIGLKKCDTSSESEKSNGRKSLNIFNFTNINYGRGRFEGSTESDDTSDSSFENVKSKRKNPRKGSEPEKHFRKGVFESSNNENVFPICYPLPKMEGRKKLVVGGEKGAFDDSYEHRVDVARKMPKVSPPWHVSEDPQEEGLGTRTLLPGEDVTGSGEDNGAEENRLQGDPTGKMSSKRKPSITHKEEVTSAAETEAGEEETTFTGTKDAEKLKMMLLAWSGGRNGERLPEDVPDEASQIWAGYHSALSLSKQTPPIRSSPTQETGSVHDETSSSGNKDDDDDEEEECEEKIDPLKYDPERLKAFNMFVRLFVDENLDRIVPISKQPKEKIQAIIDSCTRQFPEFSERARKRIRTYLKSCRRNKRTREGNAAWEPQSRPTPAHLTSVQAEQILAQACENESHNAKRMRLGLEPVTQPMPGMTTDTSTTVRSQTNNEGTRERDHYTSPVSSTNTVEKLTVKHEPNSGSVSPTVQNKTCSLEALAMASANSLSPSLLNGSAPPSSVAAAVAAAAAAPTAMYRPNFSQAFQRAASGTYTTPGLFSLPCSLTNGTRPTDLSMKNKPLLAHKLNPAEMTAVRQLITGYRESAAFLLRSADELEQLLRNQ